MVWQASYNALISSLLSTLLGGYSGLGKAQYTKWIAADITICFLVFDKGFQGVNMVIDQAGAQCSRALLVWSLAQVFIMVPDQVRGNIFQSGKLLLFHPVKELPDTGGQ
jgi:hypothetical protein